MPLSFPGAPWGSLRLPEVPWGSLGLPEAPWGLPRTSEAKSTSSEISIIGLFNTCYQREAENHLYMDLATYYILHY
jgi:hypothetical protein